jgi:putrescine aminotransferase
MHAIGSLPIPGIEHVIQPYAFNEGFGEDEEAFSTRCAQEVEDRILKVGAHNVAAFVGEPIQGAGGVIIPPKGYWQKVEAICRKYNVLLVADEVICGFGRTGQWFGHNTYGFTPDIITTAKQLSSTPQSQLRLRHVRLLKFCAKKVAILFMAIPIPDTRCAAL